MASEEMLVETLQKKKEALEEKLKGIESELSRYDFEKSEDGLSEDVPQ